MPTGNIDAEQEHNYRVLSIQSHTVSGYCGNKAAVFPLQLLGFEVDILNTVQFSNHTGYPSFKGGRLTADDVQALFDGLEQNGLTNEHTHVLTGYIGNYGILEKIEKMVQKLKAKNPNLIYVCDTVMGDEGKLYVAPEIVPLYRKIMKFADVVTPNQFEAETLTETKIVSLDDARQVAKKMHELGPSYLVITSLSLPLKDVPAKVRIELSSEESLYSLTSQLHADGQVEQHLIAFPTFPGYFTGTGDLFSSLCVARFQESIEKNGEFVDAIYRVVCSVNAIVQKTYAYQKKRIQIESNGKSDTLDSKPSAASLVRSCELRLIQGKKEIEDPEHLMTKSLINVIRI